MFAVDPLQKTGGQEGRQTLRTIRLKGRQLLMRDGLKLARDAIA